MKKTGKIIGILLSILALIFVRKFETSLFYDPLLLFFKQKDFNHQIPPEFNLIKLTTSLIFRYGLNSIITLVIIYLWYNDKKITKVCSYILGIGFLIFISLYLFSLLTNFSLGYMPTFYIRRVLIQPIFLLLLIPAIYYYKNLPTNSR